MSGASPTTPRRAHAVLRRAVELGVNLIDTAWYYGPHVANRLIAEALYPYPSGPRDRDEARRQAPARQELGAGARGPRSCARASSTDLQSLKLEQLPRRPPALDPAAGRDVRRGARRPDRRAARRARSATSRFERRRSGSSTRRWRRRRSSPCRTCSTCAAGSGRDARARRSDPEAVLAACEQRGIAFMPFFPLAIGALTAGGGSLEAAAERHRCTPAQLALAWLLARSPGDAADPGHEHGRAPRGERRLGARRDRCDDARRARA